MAKILKIILMSQDESILDFKARCSSAMEDPAFTGACTPPGVDIIGRTALTPKGLQSTATWGSAFPELPADACIIAGWSWSECRQEFHQFDEEELMRAQLVATNEFSESRLPSPSSRSRC